MMDDLANEVEAINSIYGESTLQTTEEINTYILHLPNQDSALRIEFPPDYPDAPPAILGTQTSGEHSRKGAAADIAKSVRDAVGRLWRPGEVCLFDVIEECASSVIAEEQILVQDELIDNVEVSASLIKENSAEDSDTPSWTLSDVVVEMKSVFVARCASVSSSEQARKYLQHLLDSDKKVAKATHNITAHRIKGDNGITFQDCDDDGETAAGGRLLHLLQLMDIWDVMVVVTRWYGGQKLGPARFGIINGAAREALAKAGYVEQEPSTIAQRKKGKKSAG